MKKKIQKRLALSAETLRSLDTPKLADVIGGLRTNSYCYTCEESCAGSCPSDTQCW